MDRGLYTAEHEAFRGTVRSFVAKEVTPKLEEWEQNRRIGRDAWLAAGRQGIIGLGAPEEFGGGGVKDYRYRHLIQEELGAVCANSLVSSFGLQDDILIPYFVSLGTAEQKQRWLPGLCSGELIAAIGMTEPGTGSDLRGIRTPGARSTAVGSSTVPRPSSPPGSSPISSWPCAGPRRARAVTPSACSSSRQGWTASPVAASWTRSDWLGAGHRRVVLLRRVRAGREPAGGAGGGIPPADKNLPVGASGPSPAPPSGRPTRRFGGRSTTSGSAKPSASR